MQEKTMKETMGKSKNVTKTQEKTIEIITNSQLKDSSGKMIFDEPILCAQFVRNYVDLPYMKEVQPEDIEDVSPQFVPLVAEERNADRVKKINVRGKKPFFLISLIEHKTKPEYNIVMQIFRYMVYIWEAYEKEEEKKHKGISKTKDFRYPPILPIVYYEGSQRWTAPLHFSDRIEYGEVFEKYIPNFQYYLVPIRRYTNSELLEKADEISLVMLFNKLQNMEDVSELRKISPQKLEGILSDSPSQVVKVIADVLFAFLLKVNVPLEEAEELVGKVKEKKMAELFENIEKMDIQAERRNTAEQRERAEKAEERAEKAEERAEKAESIVEKGIQLLVETCQEFSISREQTLKRLIEKYEMSSSESEEYLERYWNE
ncbi:MAG: Rpn family recombination-promoting nuclease/putative transposase [Lachnospiraceae bacterium]|nr:Rpn family recombination-promoting nuclease/putative transposase [Lachnospiraceae bacterium]